MPFKIEIPDNHIGSLKEYYKVTYENFKIKAQPLMQEWNELSPILSQLGLIPKEWVNVNFFTKQEQKIHTIPQNLNGYNPRWGWYLKSVYIINKREKPSTPREIANQIAEIYEGEIDERFAANSISATLSVAFKDGKIKRIRNEKGEYEYSVDK